MCYRRRRLIRLRGYLPPVLMCVSGCQLPALLFPQPNTGAMSIETVIAEAALPVDLAFARDGRVFYTELNTGQIRVIKNDQLLDAPFATVPCNTHNERGLLGIDLHPDFPAQPYVYVFYTRSNTGAVSQGDAEALDNRVARFVAAGDLAVGGEELLLSIPTGTNGNHNGGIIRFGPDKHLYISVGDTGDLNAPQNQNSLAGKILRVASDGSIPADNPFGPASPVYAYGLRNVFGLDFDAAGRLFANENGAGNHDEVNLIAAGANYGWPRVEGMADNGPGDPSDETAFAAANPDYRDPVVDKGDGSEGAAGLAVNRGTYYGASRSGSVLYGLFNNRAISEVAVDSQGQATSVSVFLDMLPAAVFGMRSSPEGVLWVATASSVIRIAPSAAP